MDAIDWLLKFTVRVYSFCSSYISTPQKDFNITVQQVVTISYYNNRYEINKQHNKKTFKALKLLLIIDYFINNLL